MAALKVSNRPLASLIPYARNARTHSPEQVRQIAASIKEFGWTNPILVDGANGIIAGHGRALAAELLGESEVPTIELTHLTEAQKRAYVLADNKLALNSSWDESLLAVELDELKATDFDLTLTGFSSDELEALAAATFDAFGTASSKSSPEELDNKTYTSKIVLPIYEPKGDRPELSTCVDDTKTRELVAEINKADLPDEVARFLKQAAERHTVFNFRNIAEFYAHADAKTQALMEKSALVIIDFDAAIEHGFVRMTERLAKLTEVEGWSDDS